MGARRSTAMTDDALLEAARAGDTRAFGAFYDRHFGAILVYFRRRVDDGELAFDLTAETFARLLAGVDRFDPARGSALAWMFVVARNLLVDAYRTREVSDAARRRLGMEPVDLWDRDLERLERRCSSESQALTDALAALPGEQAAAIVARIVDEQTYDEIARKLACSPSVVRQRVSRGLRNLRAGLKEQR